jgi:hypothetical protein
MVDGLCFERWEGPPARTAGIHHCSHAGTKRKPVGRQRIEAVAVGVVGLGAEEIVGMNIDQARRHVHSFGIYYLPGCFGVNIFGYGHNGIAVNGNVHHPIDAIPGINYVPALNENAVRLRCGNTSPKAKDRKEIVDCSFHLFIVKNGRNMPLQINVGVLTAIREQDYIGNRI